MIHNIKPEPCFPCLQKSLGAADIAENALTPLPGETGSIRFSFSRQIEVSASASISSSSLRKKQQCLHFLRRVVFAEETATRNCHSLHRDRLHTSAFGFIELMFSANSFFFLLLRRFHLRNYDRPRHFNLVGAQAAVAFSWIHKNWCHPRP